MIVDGRGRVNAWQSLRDAGYWSSVVAVHTAGTPPRDHGFPEVVAGSDRVDLAAMLLTLRERFDACVVRVDSGGALNGALLGAGLVDEVSLLVHPALAPSDARRPWHGGGPVSGRAITLLDSTPGDAPITHNDAPCYVLRDTGLPLSGSAADKDADLSMRDGGDCSPKN